MDSEERKILDIIVVLSKETNDRIVKFTRYLLGLVVLFMLLVGYQNYSNNATIRELVNTNDATIEELVKSNNATIRECTRLYFETNYLYPETEINQTQTIGDVN